MDIKSRFLMCEITVLNIKLYMNGALKFISDWDHNNFTTVDGVLWSKLSTVIKYSWKQLQ